MASRRGSRALLALGAAAALTAGLLTVQPAAAEPTAGAANAPAYWSITGVSESGLAELYAAGFDVAEASVDEVVVIGDSHVADELRKLGYRPQFEDTLYKPVTTVGVAADTYYGGYHTVSAHEAHLDAVAAAHPGLTTVYDIGDSWLKTQGNASGHDIKAICITKKQSGDCALRTNSAKPKFSLIGQIHARELATGEIAWKFIDHLVNGYGTDSTVTSLLDTTEVWIVPVANPDGVDYVAAGGNSPRSQRKNRNTANGSCSGTSIGVDLNRNSSYKWGADSSNPCATTYRGPSAASEPEVKALENWYRAIHPDQRGAGDNDVVPSTARDVMISLHSYGGYVIVPWGYKSGVSPNNTQLRALGRQIAAQNGYTVGTGYETVGYNASGVTDDFTYGVLGVASFTFEVGGSSGTCGGFFPAYSCMSGTLWTNNRNALIVAAQQAGTPYV